MSSLRSKCGRVVLILFVGLLGAVTGFLITSWSLALIDYRYFFHRLPEFWLNIIVFTGTIIGAVIVILHGLNAENEVPDVTD